MGELATTTTMAASQCALVDLQGNALRRADAANAVIDQDGAGNITAYTFGDPEPVLDRSSLLGYIESASNGRWYTPPVSMDGLARAFDLPGPHASCIRLKVNLLAKHFVPSRWLTRAGFRKWALDFLALGNGYLERRDNLANRPLRLAHALGRFVRRGAQDGQYFFVQGWRQEYEFAPDRVFHLVQEHPAQEIYGVPEFFGALQAGLLDEAATLFRRRYYRNGTHAGFVFLNTSEKMTALIEATPHVCYAEAFVGMGGVFFRRTARPKSEVINDWSDDVSSFFRVLQHHYVAFLEMLRFQITSRANFDKLVRQDPSTLTDLQRSARFLYLQRLAFGGKVSSRHFGTDAHGPARFDVTKLQPLLEAIHERLAGVKIARLPWSDFLRRYDRPGTLFYLDPPYYGCENDYGQALFAREEFEIMAEQLRGLRGRFILSINDHPEVRRIFAGFEHRAEDVRYTLAGMDKSKHFGELIITGGGQA